LNGNCAISVIFTPTSGGQRSGSATINDSAGAQTISLMGAAQDFSLAAATGGNCPVGGNCSTTATIVAGQTATYNLQVSPLGGFADSVSLSCGGAPGSNTCSISPSVVPPNGLSSYAFTVTVTGASNATALVEPEMPVAPDNTLRSRVPLLFGMGLIILLACGGMVGSQAKRLPAAALGLILVCFGCLGGCGGGGKTVIPPTNATLTVTGTSGGLSRTLPLSLVINHTMR
jgi:hypothetical protein